MTTARTNSTFDASPVRLSDVVALSGRGMARLVELLDHCYAFLDTHPTARFELADYCTDQPDGVTASWVIDQLGWHAALLKLQLVEQAETGDSLPYGEPGE